MQVTLRDGTTKTVKPGDYLICDIFYQVIRVQSGIYSWAFPAYRITDRFKLERVA